MVSSARFTLGVGYGWGKKLDQNLTDALRGEDAMLLHDSIARSLQSLLGPDDVADHDTWVSVVRRDDFVLKARMRGRLE